MMLAKGADANSSPPHTMLSFIYAAALSLAQVKSLTFACWAESPTPESVQLVCGVAMNDTIMDGVKSPEIKVKSMQAHELAAAYCTGIYSLLGTAPPVQTQI